MAEYLAPGVYIEETSFRSKSLEGVSTSTTAFVGPTRRGPTSGTPSLLTSYADFERIYGGSADLVFGGTASHNYIALAVQAYFENGGSRLYVARTFESSAAGDDGCASATLAGSNTTLVAVRARFPGVFGNGSVEFREARTVVSGAALNTLPVGSVVAIAGASETFAVKTATGFADAAAAAVTVTTASLCTVTMTAIDGDGGIYVIEGLAYDGSHPRFIGAVLPANPARRADALANVYAVVVGSAVTFATLRTTLLGAGGSHAITGGDDGLMPAPARYTAALAELEKVTDISIVAAPGQSAYSDAAGGRAALLTHVHKRGLYRVAVLDSAQGDTTEDIQATRGGIDSHHAALYYPWVVISNPNARAGDARQPAEIEVPPSGFICGIYARNDAERGVSKSPANEVLRGALRLEQDISFGENEALNPYGINCLRYFPGRGYRVWGARTVSSDPEWKYLSVRRYFNYLESTIERGTQWAVFESNGPALWANIRETITSFLYNEWRQGALLGESEKEAYFVRCDLSTMTQNDLDNGRLVCLVGVAVVKPAEFVVFRIGQKTATTRD